MDRLTRTFSSSRTRLTLRLLWIVTTLGLVALGLAAPMEYDIP